MSRYRPGDVLTFVDRERWVFIVLSADDGEIATVFTLLSWRLRIHEDFLSCCDVISRSDES